MSRADDLIAALSRETKGKTRLLKGRGYVADTIPTGVAVVDDALGGGFGKGRIVELFGNESTGKTMLLLLAMAQVQRRGGLAVHGDIEGCYDEEIYTQLGGNPEEMLLIEERDSDTVENLFNFLYRFLKVAKGRKESGEGEDCIVGVDSVAALASKHLMETGMDKADMSIPRALSQGMKLIQSTIKKTDVALVLINQVREKLDSKDSALLTPGGRAIKFHASQRISLRFDGGSKTSLIHEGNDKDGTPIGHWTEGQVVKNRLASPQQTFRLPIYTVAGYPHPVFGTPTRFGIDLDEALFDYYLTGQFFLPGTDHERVLIQKGAWYAVHPSLQPDGKSWHAKDWPSVLESVPGLRTLIYEQYQETKNEA